MFEMIGLAIGTGILLLMGLVLGILLCGLFAWLLWGKHGWFKWLLLGLAFALPVASAGYVVVCTALLPGESLFGDIDQPLRNGYRLTGLGKMSEYLAVGKGGPEGILSPSLPHPVYELAMEGQDVVGRYSREFGDSAGPLGNFFLLDTRNDEVATFPTQALLEAKVGHPVTLVEGVLFRSTEPQHLKQQRRNHLAIFTPPILGLLGLLGFAVWFRFRRFAPRSSSAMLFT